MYIGIPIWSKNMKREQKRYQEKFDLLGELDNYTTVEPKLSYDSTVAKQMALFSALVYLSDDKSLVKSYLKKYNGVAYFYDCDDTEAMIFKTGKSIIVSFRGTEPTEMKDVMTDLNIIPRKGEKQGIVHSGFANALDKIWDNVQFTIDRIYRRGDTVYFTGHSLGGALATVAAARSKYIGQVYTFGQPRVGNKEYAKNVKSKIYRHVAGADIVPSVPLGLIYRHMGQCYFVEDGCAPIKSDWRFTLKRMKCRIRSLFSWRPLFRLIKDHDITYYYRNL